VPALSGIFSSIRDKFADIANTNLVDLLKQTYEFRNDYIAHEKKDEDEEALLIDEDQARNALNVWLETLNTLYVVQHYHGTPDLKKG